MTVLNNSDLDAIFDDLAAEFEHLRRLRKSQRWPTDTAVREVLFKQLHLVREALSLASVMSMSREWKKK